MEPTITISLSLALVQNQLPTEFVLDQNYPNPFNPVTQIRFAVPDPQFINVRIYDVLGREVAVLVDEKFNPGLYTVTWNAGGFPSGIYYYQLRTPSFTATRKLTLLK